MRLTMSGEYDNFLNGHSTDDGLVQLALEDIKKSGLFPETLKQAQVKIFNGNGEELKDRLGRAFLNGHSLIGDFRLIEFPYFNESGDFVLYRYKVVPTTTDKGGREVKYLHPIGKPAIPYIIKDVWAIKDKPHKPVWITEGEKKALALLQYGRPAIALSGVWNFKAGANSDLENDKTLWTELEIFSWKGRMVYLAFDNDLWFNPSVRSAMYELSFKLLEKGATIRVVIWQDSKGIDDFLAVQDDPDDALSTLELYTSKDLESFLTSDHRSEILRALSLMTNGIEKERLVKIFSRRIGVPCKIVKKACSEGSEGDSEGVQEIFSAYFDGLIDLVLSNGATSFLIKDEHRLTAANEVKTDNKLLRPPQNVPWVLPSAEKIISHYEKLILDPTSYLRTIYDDVLTYYKGIAELPSEGYYHLLTVWTLHSYLIEKFQYSPIICLYAVPERGKSRTGKGMIYLAYRGLHVLSLREAYILRACHDLHATLFFDVMDIWDKAEKNNTEDILLSKFERGLLVPRVNYPEKGPHEDTVYYNVFGATVLATNEPVHNILETRAIQLNMPQSSRTFDNDVRPENAIELKERLLAVRSYFLDKDLPGINKPVAGRLGDITRPLLQVMRLVRPDYEKPLIELIKQIESERLLERTECIEAYILNALNDLHDAIIEGNKLTIEAITTKINERQPEGYKFRNTTIGRKLSSLGFEKTRIAGGKMAVTYNPEKIYKIRCSYGLEKASLPSQPSPEGNNKTAVLEQSEGSEGNLRSARERIFEMEIEL